MLKRPKIVAQMDFSYFPNFQHLCFKDPEEIVSRPIKKILRRKTLEGLFSPENMKALESQFSLKESDKRKNEKEQKILPAKDFLPEKKKRPLEKSADKKPRKSIAKAEPRFQMNKETFKGMKTATKVSFKPDKDDLLSKVSSVAENNDYEDLKFTDQTLKNEESKARVLNKDKMKKIEGLNKTMTKQESLSKKRINKKL